MRNGDGGATVKERPILFSGEMVRAILDGRKTQTRRVMKPQLSPNSHDMMMWRRGCQRMEHLSPLQESLCPYGQPGDRLWVRETSRAHELTDKEAEADTFGVIERLGLEVPPCGLDGVVYAADNAFREIENSREASERWMKMNAYRGMQGATVPAIHMPRWASRIELEITGVRVERLQEISEEDARAEGSPLGRWYHPPNKPEGDSVNLGAVGTVFNATWEHPSYRNGFAALWYSINGRRGYAYEMNPWVWVIEFKAAQP